MSWKRLNDYRGELIAKKVARTITPDERAELDALQTVAGIRSRLLHPFPGAEMEAMRARLEQMPEEKEEPKP